VTRRWARALAWGSVGVTVAAIPTVRLIIAKPHPGQLGVESRRPRRRRLSGRAYLTALSQGSWDESTAASVPLRVGGRNVGRLDLGRRNNGVGFAPRELEHLQKAADVVAAAISVSHESHTVGAHPLVGSGSKRTARFPP